MSKRVMYSTKVSEDQLLKLRQLSVRTKIPQTKLIEEAFDLLFQRHDEISRKLGA